MRRARGAARQRGEPGKNRKPGNQPLEGGIVQIMVAGKRSTWQYQQNGCGEGWAGEKRGMPVKANKCENKMLSQRAKVRVCVCRQCARIQVPVCAAVQRVVGWSPVGKVTTTTTEQLGKLTAGLGAMNFMLCLLSLYIRRNACWAAAGLDASTEPVPYKAGIIRLTLGWLHVNSC